VTSWITLGQMTKDRWHHRLSGISGKEVLILSGEMWYPWPSVFNVEESGEDRSSESLVRVQRATAMATESEERSIARSVAWSVRRAHMSIAIKMTPQEIKERLAGRSWTVDDEKGVQDALAEIFPELGREHSFSPRDRVDFFDPETGMAVEVKVKGGDIAVLRQLGRYLDRPEVTSVVLVTSSFRLASSMPEELHGKPIAVVYLSAAF